MHRMRIPILAPIVAALVTTAACASPAEPPLFDPFSPEGIRTGADATVRWNGLEGGFWTLRLADGRVLDPHETLPPEYRVDGRRVHVRVEPLAAVSCFHQVGLIVAITDIQGR
jgi:hypothetical protein